MQFFRHTGDKQIPILSECDRAVDANHPGARTFKPVGDGLFSSELQFAARDGERLYGMGENAVNAPGKVNLKGCTIDLFQRHMKACVPLVVSSEGYGFLWNNPSLGKVEFGSNKTRWISYGCKQLDYFITAGDSYADIMENYADATGHAPQFPYWASGFWQCKLRYQTQDEFLGVAREFKRRGLPLSVLVIDFFHWDMMGNWRLDPECLARPQGHGQGNGRDGREDHDLALDPGGCEEREFRVHEGTWPIHRFHWREEGYHQQRRLPIRPDQPGSGQIPLEQMEAELRRSRHPHVLARSVRRSSRDPRLRPGPLSHRSGQRSATRSSRGPSEEHLRGIACRRREGGGDHLPQCLGRQPALWGLPAPHDINCSFEDLEIYMKVGLNVMMSGIPWWSCDTGFVTPDNSSPRFRELMARWYQYEVFLPVFRTHACRPNNEPWNIGGKTTYRHIRAALLLRERLRPYVMEQMKLASQRGLPPMRPLFFDFMDDPKAAAVEDEYLFGPDLLVAPVTKYEMRSREVYLPAGVEWTDAWTGKKIPGGQVITADAPIEHIPVYVRGDKPALLEHFRDLYRRRTRFPAVSKPSP